MPALARGSRAIDLEEVNVRGLGRQVFNLPSDRQVKNLPYNRRSFRIAEVLLEEEGSSGPDLFHHHRLRDHVRQAGKWQQFKSFAVSEQGVGQSQGVPEVHIIIRCAVNQQERPLEFASVRSRAKPPRRRPHPCRACQDCVRCSGCHSPANRLPARLPRRPCTHQAA